MDRQRFVLPLLLAGVVAVTFAPITVAAAQALKFQGVLNDYTDTANNAGAWHITGTWSIFMKGKSGTADVIASIAMIRDGSGVSPHTHHLVLEDVPVAKPMQDGPRRDAGPARSGKPDRQSTRSTTATRPTQPPANNALAAAFARAKSGD